MDVSASCCSVDLLLVVSGETDLEVAQRTAGHKTLQLLSEQVVSVSMATTVEQPGLAKRGLGVLLPLFLSESQTRDVSGQSILTDDQTRWRRESPSSQQRLKKSSDTIKHCLQ